MSLGAVGLFDIFPQARGILRNVAFCQELDREHGIRAVFPETSIDLAKAPWQMRTPGIFQQAQVPKADAAARGHPLFPE